VAACEDGMKSMVLIPLAVLACVGVPALILWFLHVRFSPLDPIDAAVITAIAASIGILPLLRTAQTDPTAIVQIALIGTILHLMCTAALSIAVVTLNLANFRGPFIFWLLGAFWVSLAILVRQLRRVMLDLTATPKVQN